MERLSDAARELAEDLEALIVETWPADESHRIDGWAFKAARGITGRANSVTALAAHGRRGLDARVEEAEAWYGARGLATQFRLTAISAPPELADALAARGYGASAPTHVMTTDLNDLIGRLAEVETGAFALEAAPGEAWRRAQARAARDQADAAARADLIARAPCEALFADETGARASGAALIARGWVGFFAIAVAAEARRRGLARGVTAALARGAAAKGAFRAYLQVEAENGAALALYRALGFRRVYDYRYFRAGG